MRYRLFIIPIFVFYLGVSAFAQGLNDNSSLNRIKSLNGEEFRNAVELYYDSLKYVVNYQDRMCGAKQMFEITASKDEKVHIFSLIFWAMNTEGDGSKLLNQAFLLATKYNLYDDICNVDYNRSYYYMARKQYDSAMISILRYRDMTPPELGSEGYRNILNLLGDNYFYAGLYEKAADVYHKLYQQYEKEENLNYYRPYVMLNNLGLIALANGKTLQARDLFISSLKLAEKYLNTSYRNNTLAYIKIKLAETALKSDSIEVARCWIDEVAKYPKSSVFEDVLQDYLLINASVMLEEKNLDSALLQALQLIPEDTVKFGTYRFISEAYMLLSEIYLCKGDGAMALKYSQKFNKIKDSLNAQEHMARSMILLADHNHELTQIELEKSKQQVFLLIIGLIILVIVILIILILYRKLYRSKLELVKRSVEKATAVDASVKENLLNQTSPNNTDAKKQQKLIKDLQLLMERDKPFLNSGLKIIDIADALNTNRTYISQAINNELNTTFPNLINEYRIKEAISLITSGYNITHTMEALAKKSGFANRVVFNNAFKKYTGVVPSFFIANHKKYKTG